MTILDKIIAEKKKEVSKLKQKTIKKNNFPKIKTLQERILERQTMSIIAEIKRASPSKGTINDSVDPVKQAIEYSKNGASAISVLTDTPFFKGTMDDLRMVREVVDIPILCKDFIIDKIQIDHAKSAGANIILLIAAALNDEDLIHLYNYARELDLEVLCEVHNEEEMERILKLNAPLIGINNRNLKTFEVDLKTTARLGEMIDNPNTILVSESGIAQQEDVDMVAQYGAKAILVGETLMRTDDVGQTMTSFQIPLTK